MTDITSPYTEPEPLTPSATTPISIRLPNHQIDYLKSIARYIAYHRNEDITYVDLIREAIDNSFSMLTTSDEANKQKIMALTRGKFTESERAQMCRLYDLAVKNGYKDPPDAFIKPMIEKGEVGYPTGTGLSSLQIGKIHKIDGTTRPIPIRGTSYWAEVTTNECDEPFDKLQTADLHRPLLVGTELKKAYCLLDGCPVYSNVKNANDITKALGAVWDVKWNETLSTLTVCFTIDEEAYPDIIRGIQQGYIHNIKAIAIADYAVCNLCGYIGHHDDKKGFQWCEHKTATKKAYGLRPYALTLVAD